ncbi:NUDIX hydrolase [Chloroflexota bacterium]
MRRYLYQRQKRHLFNASRVSAGVLLPLYWKQGEEYLLFTKRSESVKDHKGQISFPGGVYHVEDKTLQTTALRECAEEIGLALGDIEILGELDDIETLTSNYIISPFVAFISWPFSLKVNRREIEEIIEVPLRVLLEKDRVRHGTEIIDGERITSHCYCYQGNVIWGATAGILNQFLHAFTQANKR